MNASNDADLEIGRGGWTEGDKGGGGDGGGGWGVNGWDDGLDGGTERNGLSPYCRDILRLIKY